MTSPDAVAPRDESRRTHVHPIQVSRAFGPGGRAFVARLVDTDGATARVAAVTDGSVTTLTIGRPDALATVLERDDLTLLDGAPLVLVAPRHGVLGVATGPPTPPERLAVVAVSRLEGGHAVEVPASDADQPSLQLFAATVTEGAPS